MSSNGIQTPESAELPQLVRLVQDCTAAMRVAAIDQWDEVYPDEKTLRDDIDAGTLFVFRAEERVIGCVVLNEFQDPEYAEVPWEFVDGPIRVVHRLMIHPDFQGQGIARLLMDFVEIQAAVLGVKTLRLDAFSQNPAAVKLYDRLGYRRAGMVQLRKGAFHCFEKRLTSEENS